LFGARVLIVAAHPDDEVLGCGGTIRLLIEEGVEILVLYLSDGVTSRGSRGEKRDSHDIESRLSDAKLALRELGVLNFRALGLKDNQLDSYPILKIAKLIESVVGDFEPTFVITHSLSDLNVDHRVANQGVLTACRPEPSSQVRGIASFEVLSSTGWQFDSKNQFAPNLFVDISESLESKISALGFFKNEIREFPHPRSLAALESLAKSRGAQLGITAAEAFEIHYLRL
jgi:LmbE family N-acetylglucosaminyl deacetylase